MKHREVGIEKGAVGISPYDTAASSGTRFLIEVAAWIAGPWAAASWSGSGWVAVPALIVLVAIPAVFSTQGDKKQIVVATPGPIRILIELGLLAVAIVAAFAVWPTWAAAAVVVVGAVMLVSGLRRYQWLASGAPSKLS